MRRSCAARATSPNWWTSVAEHDVVLDERYGVPALNAYSFLFRNG